MDEFLPTLRDFCDAVRANPAQLQAPELKFFRDCMHEHLSSFATSSEDEDDEAPPPSTDEAPIVLDLSTHRPCQSSAPPATPRLEDLVANPAVMNMAKHMMGNPELMQQMLSSMSARPGE